MPVSDCVVSGGAVRGESPTRAFRQRTPVRSPEGPNGRAPPPAVGGGGRRRAPRLGHPDRRRPGHRPRRGRPAAGWRPRPHRGRRPRPPGGPRRRARVTQAASASGESSRRSPRPSLTQVSIKAPAAPASMAASRIASGDGARARSQSAYEAAITATDGPSARARCTASRRISAACSSRPTPANPTFRKIPPARSRSARRSSTCARWSGVDASPSATPRGT